MTSTETGKPKADAARGGRAIPGAKATNLPNGPLDHRTIHLCVDMQRLFGAGSPWATPWIDRVLPPVQRLAAHRPEHTIFTRFIPPHRASDLPGRWAALYRHWPQITRERLPLHFLNLLPELEALCPPATVIDKSYYSPFFETALTGMLRRRAIEALVITGAETDVCVLAAVLDAVDLGLRVIVVRDAICSSSDETHDALMTLYSRRLSNQIELADADTVIDAWPR